ncbi:hypothetical protein [Psychroserpens damuponensis]|uniref:hypothetical protein n=1 Tax=Psychroserpens damuponensis TaxID=943936 RepID=UPI000693DA4F|nr:hypothetical protein [Psychroserpens damuponensis]
MNRNHYTLKGNTLTLFVKPAPIVVSVLMFVFSFMLFTLPIVGLIRYISEGNGIKAGFFLMIFIFSLLGFYLLRIALWNTYGKEEITFSNNLCTYTANYRWFKDGVKTEYFDTINFAKNPVGYLEDNNYTLVIEDFNAENEIMCVIKMPETTLEQLIRELKENIGNAY